MLTTQERDEVLEEFREAKNYYESIKFTLPNSIQEALTRIEEYHLSQIEEMPDSHTIDKNQTWQNRFDLQGWEVFHCPESNNYRFVIENISPQEIIYDVGAGDLRLDLILSQKCRKVYAVEINPRIMGPSLELIGYDMPTNLIAICADALKLPLPEDTTTIVILLRHLIHPIPEYWKEKKIISNANYEPLQIWQGSNNSRKEKT